ncbi:thiolase C-terminal domain-containing protein, partial [Streptomyces hydrogenans]|uniref:thiolase C-terminal domain-containing protein n=1 Tax=Streptomyces hydrogenans TaxID=1873719 RepID=UPI0037FBE27F
PRRPPDPPPRPHRPLRHPLTGLAQAAELVWQLRGEAAGRQVTGARVGLAHNIGLGGAAVVTLLRRSQEPGREA